MKHTVCTRRLKNGTPILVVDLRKLGEALVCAAVIIIIMLAPSLLQEKGGVTMPIITIRDIEDAYKDKQATQEWNQGEMQMEYQDFYDIADYFNSLNCQVYTEKEIATNAYEYKSEYDYSMRKGKPTRTMIELCKLCCEDMDYLNYPQIQEENAFTVGQMQEILSDFMMEMML